MNLPHASPFLSDTPVPPAGGRVPDGLEAELAERLRWFVRLRWTASAGLGLLSVLGPVTGFPGVSFGLRTLAGAVLLYNAVFFRWLNHPRLRPVSATSLRANAVIQIVLDLAALLAAVHLTGGLGSALLPFFGFHMAIGTILLGSETMSLVAALTSLAAVGLHVLESGGLLAHALPGGLPQPSSFALLALVGFLFGIVYVTGSVSDRLKQRNEELRRASQALEERSAELQRTLDEIEELERRKSHYMRVSAHQLRSPLGTVRTSLDVLAGGYVDLSSERGQRLIRGAADRINGLLLIVNGLLDLAKVREGRQRAPWTRHVNLNQLLVDLADSLGPYAEERSVHLDLQLAETVVLDWGVPPDLVQAFENLIQNAVKYSLPGGRVSVRLWVSGGRGLLDVDDQGIGIPPEFREQLFLEFLRAPNARRHAAEGTGLGLALVREVALAHGGHVWLQERPGPGTCFRMELPLRRIPPEVTRSLLPGDEPGYDADTKRAVPPA